MASKPPDYDLLDRLELTSPAQVRAIGHPLRTTVLGLLHERAATVTELAGAVGRPKSTVAHHVKVLADAGLLHVVRTRRVRAIDERYYGRTARMFYVGVGRRPGDEPLPLDFNDFEVAAQESAAAYEAHRLWAFIRHARISPDRASEFWNAHRRPGPRVRRAPALGHHRVRLRRRHLSHGPPDPADRRRRRLTTSAARRSRAPTLVLLVALQAWNSAHVPHEPADLRRTRLGVLHHTGMTELREHGEL